jgi:hemolysin activation/secretion protein
MLATAGRAHAQAAPPPAASVVTPKDIAPRSQEAPQAALPAAAAAKPPPGSENLRFKPSIVTVDGGLPELAAEERALTSAVSGVQISVAEFYALAAKIEAAYVRRGYPFARVAVPPQHLADGQPARLIIVDGFIEQVDVSAVPKRLRGHIRALLRPLVNKHWLRFGELERHLMLAGDTPGVQIRSAIAPGRQEGGVRLIIEVTSHLVGGSVSVDNNLGPAFRGREGSVQLALNSPFGLGEQAYVLLSGDPAVSGESLGRDAPRRVIAGGLSVPLGDQGLKATAEATQSITQPLGGLFATRDVFTRYAFRLTQPLIRRRQEDLNVTLSFEDMVERQTAPQFAVILFEDRYRLFRAAVNYDRQMPGALLNLGATLTVGDGDQPGTLHLSRAAASPHFVKAEFSGAYAHALPAGFQSQLQVRGQVMLSGGEPTSELFILDGPQSLSSFTSGTITADQGFVARAALTRPFSLHGGRVTLTPGIYDAEGRGYFIVSTPYDVTRANAYGLTLDCAVLPPRSAQPVVVSLDWGRGHSNGPEPHATRLSAAISYAF